MTLGKEYSSYAILEPIREALNKFFENRRPACPQLYLADENGKKAERLSEYIESGCCVN
jgi:hypothetical protein